MIQLRCYLVDINTVIANLAGIPAISLPVGFSNGLPIGLQIMAAPFEEQSQSMHHMILRILSISKGRQMRYELGNDWFRDSCSNNCSQ